MNPMEEREIRDLLTPDDQPVPPADLAARIKAEIPADLTLTPASTVEEPSNVRPFARRPWHQRGWMLAASLVVIVGGVWLTRGLLDAPPEMAMSTSDVAVGQREASPQGAIDQDAMAPKNDRSDTAPEPESISIESEPLLDAMDFGTPPAPTDDRRQAAAGDEQQANGAATSSEPVALLRADKVTTQPDAERLRLADRSRAMEQESAALNHRLEELKGSTEAQPSALPAPSPPAVSDASRRSPRSSVSTDTALSKQEEYSGMGYEDIEETITVMAEPQVADERNTAGSAVGRLDGAPKEKDLNRPARADRAAPERTAEDRMATPMVQKPQAMTFRDYGTNPFVATEVDALSTFALDVDTGSYNLVRRYLTEGRVPPAEAIRVEEMVNRFHYGDAPPAAGEDFAVRAEGAPVHLLDDPRRYWLRFGVQGRVVADAQRPPADLVFVVDVSGSMQRENRLGMVREALYLLVDQLGPSDRVALVIYGSRGQVVLPLVSDHDAIRRALGQLTSNGSTNAEEGLRLGYEQALSARGPGTISRLILCSDGVANVGHTSAEAILAMVRHATDAGVELTTVGFGMGNYNDVLMEQLADQGNGRYAYVDDLDEARRIFVESLTGTLLTIAAEAKAQVAFNSDVVARYRLIGYENRDVADRDFRNDAVDAGEIGAGHAVTALYEVDLQPHVVTGPGWRDRLATLTLRWGSIAQGAMVEREWDVTGEDVAVSWTAASPALRWSTLVARFGEQLKNLYGAPGLPMGTLREEVERLSPALYENADFVAFRSLVARAAELDPSP